MSLNFKFSKNNIVLKELNVNTTSLSDYSEYRKSLKSLQGGVNEYLTTLVSADTASLEPNIKHEESDEYLSSDSESKQSPKRTLSNNRGGQKNKVHKH